ncbi:MAG: hypothetical protein GC158_07710 [Cyanobacteria bacterium RI_101]|nr:hypothetical protein [Cyanobacteria bacterium RI_101]
MPTVDDLNRALTQLSDHPEALRIKKLIYSLCKNLWENDPTKLESHSLKSLLIELLKTHPNLKRLIIAAHGLVLSLNRQEVYAPLAKYILMTLAPIYNTTPEMVERSIIQTFIEERDKTKEKRTQPCINLMEVLVKDEVYRELQKLPVNAAKFISTAEVATFALNRLPPLYVSSEEGRYYQSQKAEQLKENIHGAVRQGIAAVMRDPLRKSTPLNLGEVDKASTAHNMIMELEEFVREIDGHEGKMSYEELTEKLKTGVNLYENAIKEIDAFFRLHGLTKEKLTVHNLAKTVRQVYRRFLKEEERQPARGRVKDQQSARIQRNLDSQETSIREFIQHDEATEEGGETNFATSIRDWYTF